MRVIILRPEPGNSQTLKAVRQLGLDALAMPLQQVEPVAWQMPEGDFDGLLIGSANAIRHAGSDLHRLRDLPVYAVGQTTEAAARAAGFGIASTGSGGLQSVVDTLASDQPMRLLRLGGEETVPLAPPANVSIENVTVYKLETCAAAAERTNRPADTELVLVHSASAMRQLEDNCHHLGLIPCETALAVLGPRIADEARLAWKSIHIASRPDDAVLLALAKQICQGNDQVVGLDHGGSQDG